MTPITQTELYDPARPDHRGNCWQTVLASVLDLPLDEVPHFVQDDHTHNGRENFEWDWWKRSIDWLRDRGMKLEYAKVDETPGEYLLVSGKSPRGDGTIYHVVIYRDGVMVHDPHPDGTGLLTVESNAYAIRPIAGQA